MYRNKIFFIYYRFIPEHFTYNTRCILTSHLFVQIVIARLYVCTITPRRLCLSENISFSFLEHSCLKYTCVQRLTEEHERKNNDYFSPIITDIQLLYSYFLFFFFRRGMPSNPTLWHYSSIFSVFFSMCSFFICR
jgi:hypothetical protein